MISFRPVKKTDEALFIQWENSSDYSHYMSRIQPLVVMPDGSSAIKLCWLLIVSEDEPIGTVWLEEDPSQLETMILGVMILGDHYRGKGLGKLAIHTVIDTALKQYVFKRIRLNVRENNKRAIRCYEGAGFTLYKKANKKDKKGNRIPYFMMEMRL